MDIIDFQKAKAKREELRRKIVEKRKQNSLRQAERIAKIISNLEMIRKITRDTIYLFDGGA